MVTGPALPLSNCATLGQCPVPDPHRQSCPQSSGFYLPDPLRAPALGAEEGVTPGDTQGQTGEAWGVGVLRLGHQLLRRVVGMSEKESGRKPAGCQGHQKNGTIFPKGALWPWCPCVLAQTASLCSSYFLGQKVKMGKKQRVPFTRDPWLGGQRSLEKWPGLGDSGKAAGAFAPGGWGRRCSRHSSAGAQCRAALGTVAHQALVGFEARQGLAAGDGGQGAAEAQHGGRGVLPWGS